MEISQFQGETCDKEWTEASKMFEFMPPPKKVTYRDTKEYNIVEIQEPLPASRK